MVTHTVPTMVTNQTQLQKTEKHFCETNVGTHIKLTAYLVETIANKEQLNITLNKYKKMKLQQ